MVNKRDCLTEFMERSKLKNCHQENLTFHEIQFAKAYFHARHDLAESPLYPTRENKMGLHVMKFLANTQIDRNISKNMKAQEQL